MMIKCFIYLKWFSSVSISQNNLKYYRAEHNSSQQAPAEERDIEIRLVLQILEL